MKFALICDVLNWAYHADCLGLQKYMVRHGFDVDVYSHGHFTSVLTHTERMAYDSVLLFPRYAPDIGYPPTKTVGVYSSFGDYEAEAKQNEIRFASAVCVNRQIHELAVVQLARIVPYIYYVPSSVDTELFRPAEGVSSEGRLVVGWAGNAEKPGKRFEIVEKAIARLKQRIEFKAALWSNRIPHKHMPAFYRSIHLFVCVSEQEGGPLTAVEAGACGVPTISACPKSAFNEIMTDMYDGFKIERTADALYDKIVQLDRSRELLESSSTRIAETIRTRGSWAINWEPYAHILTRVARTIN